MRLLPSAKFRRATVGHAGMRAQGFSLVELMVVMAIIIVVATLITTYVARARMIAQQTVCLSNLRQIHHAFMLYASYNEQRLPPPSVKGYSWERLLSPYLNPDRAYYCPADSDIFHLVGSSYDWRDTGPPPPPPDLDTTLAGKLASSLRTDAVMAYDQLFGWHGKHTINVVRLDGSAGPTSDDDFANDLAKPVAVGQ